MHRDIPVRPGLARDVSAATGRTATADAIVRDARAGDGAAAAALDRYLTRLARALATVINVLDPDVIVLGGGLSNVDEIYLGVPARWAPFVFSDEVHTRLARARHGDTSGVRGAARLWGTSEFRILNSEFRRQKAEGRRQKAEGRRQK
ncbi:MAG: ROK family protein [Vicinamibacterales bacterium]